MSPMVLRCEACAAPLKRTSFVVTCRHCGSENRIGAHPDAAEHAARLVVAAKRAREAGPEASRRCEEIYAEYQGLAELAMGGDRDAGRRAVERMEGYVRMTYLPTMILVDAMDPDDESTQEMLRQLDAVVDEVCANTAKAFDVPYARLADRAP